MATDRELLTSFGRRLSALLGERDLTQRELSGASGAHVNAVGGWVRGKRWPRPENLLAIAEALDVTVDWLLTGQETDPVEDGPGAGKARALADLAELAPALDALADRIREATTAS